MEALAPVLGPALDLVKVRCRLWTTLCCHYCCETFHFCNSMVLILVVVLVVVAVALYGR